MKQTVFNGRTGVITGISGQDGHYLAHHLLHLGYRVVGVMRRTSTPNDERLRTLKGSPNLVLVDGDVTDVTSLQDIVRTFQPDEFFNLAAMSHVGLSWKYPLMTVETTGMGVLNCLEAIRKEKPDCRFYQAGSSEQFGNSIDKTKGLPWTVRSKMGLSTMMGGGNCLNENSPMEPESPYAAAKCFGHDIVNVYRNSYGIHASVGILFNHESPLRGETFVTRKITRALARIYHGLQEKISLGNISAKRDWGFSGDYCDAMRLMLQQDSPDDYVIASGEAYSVREFLEHACKFFKLNPDDILEIDEKYKRPSDIECLIGDSSKAKDVLGWKPKKSFKDLVDLMCQHDKYYYSPKEEDRRRADEFLS